MFHCVLIEYHPMLGVDLHEDVVPPLPPAPPTPVPFAPHLTTALLNWVVPAATADTVHATPAHGRVMKRGTDIQNFIPHIPLTPAAMLALLLTSFSGSKSYFGPASVLVKKSPVAVALALVVNYNLNCGDIPTVSGIVMAPNTVVAGMTWGDLLGGLFAMYIDAAMQAALNKLMPSGLGGGILGLFVGSPLGFAFNANGSGPVGSVGRATGYLSDLFRSFGESLGGDSEQGAKDRDDLWERLNKDKGSILDWNICGKDGDAERLGLPSSVCRPDGVIDHPAAEQF
jgi:hypothetical protein